MKFEIIGKSGTYTVKFDMISHHMWHMNIMAWSCTCPSYVKGRNLNCKHIKKVEAYLKLKEIIKEVIPCVI